MDKVVEYIVEKGWSELWRYLAEKLGTAFLILVLGLIIIKIIMVVLRKFMKRTRLDPSAHAFVLSCIRVCLLIILAALFLGALGVETTSIIAAIGSCGVAVALALKDSLTNVAGGIIIIATKRFIKGDYIKIGDYEGTVEKIDFMSTTLLTIDGKHVIVSNGTANTSTVVNYNKSGARRVDCVFSIARDDDIMLAKRILHKAAEDNILVLDSPEPVIAVKELGTEYVDLACYVWCGIGKYYDTSYSMQEQVAEAFKKAGLTSPRLYVSVFDETESQDGA